VQVRDTSNVTKRSRDFQQMRDEQDKSLSSKAKHKMTKLDLQAAGVA
jgi:hypothetical protein